MAQEVIKPNYQVHEYQTILLFDDFHIFELVEISMELLFITIIYKKKKKSFPLTYIYATIYDGR